MQTAPWQRRSLLGAGLALLGACAAPAAGGARARVVVVGGGWAGCMAARALVRGGGDSVAVTLVEREPAFVSCPISNGVLGGTRRLADITRPYSGLVAAGVRVVRGEVVGIAADARRVHLADGSELGYERLLLAPGIDFMLEEMGGLGAQLASGRVTHAWKAGPQTALLRAQLEAMPDGGVFAICIPPLPYRCPPAPYERACLVAEYFSRAKPRAKVLVLDANPEIASEKALFERAFSGRWAGRIELRPNSELKDVAAEGTKQVAKLEFEDVAVDVLNVIPPQRGGELARRAGLLNINRRWAGVDWLSMESTAVPGIHVLGDSVFPAPVMPKSGHMAQQHGLHAAAAVLRLLRGEAPGPPRELGSSCYSFVAADAAGQLRSTHRYDAAERTFKPVPGATSLAPSPTAALAQQAQAWAENAWAEMLALQAQAMRVR
jgi:sulfite dehydrogenase